ncbi:MAG: ClC family H(+)/Cl(-) exchange transporter [Lachnospiraceae bacterium]|nr:ClC family H(+)/Cl(-) exchange transporter [Lachnospiraceae bacterium]
MKRYKESAILMIEGIFVGILAGLTVVLYRFCLTEAETAMFKVWEYIHNNPLSVILWFLILIALGCIVGRVLRLEPMASGSGVPHVAGEAKEYLDPCWWRVIIAKFIGGSLCLFGGLSLGKAGPSVQLGAMAAKGFCRTRKHDRKKEITLLCCGAGAGLAAIFHAPLAGSLFVLEQIRHTYDRTLLIAGVVSALAADFTSKLFLGQTTMFSFPTATIPLHLYWLLILLGILAGLAGAGYNTVMLKAQALFQHFKKVPKEILMSSAFLAVGIFGLTLPQVLGGGQAMISILDEERPALLMLVLLLAIKFIVSAVSFGCGAPGGIFFPLLTLGAYLGAAFGSLAVICLGLPEELWAQFIILGMAGLFVGIIRAPLTGILLLVEMTGSMNHLPDIALVCVTACFFASLTSSKPIFTSLLERLIKNNESLSEKP